MSHYMSFLGRVGIYSRLQNVKTMSTAPSGIDNGEEKDGDEKGEATAGNTHILDVIDQLANEAFEAEQSVKRLDRLDESARLSNLPKAVQERAETNKRTARRKSRDLQDEMACKLDAMLETAFKEFDLDGNGTLNKDELSAAFEAAGRPMSAKHIEKAIAAIDKNGDGVVDMDEFKQIAIRGSMAAQAKSWSLV
eukprot:5510285-Prymnesium_polylepis.1